MKLRVGDLRGLLVSNRWTGSASGIELTAVCLLLFSAVKYKHIKIVNEYIFYVLNTYV